MTDSARTPASAPLVGATRRAALLATVLLTAAAATLSAPASAQMEPTTPRGADEGDGPHERLILRGATIIDGTGAPPMGPVDIVIEGDRIAQIRTVGYPGVPIDEDRRPSDATKEMDMTGMFVMPGFVDMHAHTGGRGEGAPARVHV